MNHKSNILKNPKLTPRFQIKCTDIPGYANQYAFTLEPGVVGKHDNGWEVSAEIHEDYYEWVNFFEAYNPKFGSVWGDFEDVVFASSKTAYNDFLKYFQPQQWDYDDI